MRRPNQLILESAVIASVMVMLTLGGSITTTIIPGSFLPLQNPANVTPQYDLSGLAQYYNVTLTQIGTGNFAGASFLLATFEFVNIPSGVNATAQAANADLAELNITIPQAQRTFASAEAAIQADELINATALVDAGCALAQSANSTFADFIGPQTHELESESVPTLQYQMGQGLVSREVLALLGDCVSTSSQIPGAPPPGTSGKATVLLIGSEERALETGGPLDLFGNVTEGVAGIPGQRILFYINGSYFGSLSSDARGKFSGTLPIPYVYFRTAMVQALVKPNFTAGTAGALSNGIDLTILFNQTSIVVGDPPAYLPGATFSVHGNLTSDGVPLPYAPVTVTYLRDSVHATTDGSGTFRARFTVPDNATDGVYHVYAQFTPKGVYGPSFNFTSIEVRHLPLVLTFTVPGLSWAGFSTHIDGTATTNGTGLDSATVTLSSPWGRATTTTDQQGHFSLSFPVSPFEFAFSRNVLLSGAPAQPYIASATAEATLGLFNFLLVVIPAAIIGIGAFEANSLGAFRGLGRRRGKRGQDTGVMLSEIPYPQVPPVHEAGPEPLELLGRALGLASARFYIVFQPSQTIREMLSQVGAREGGAALEAFSGVLSAAEEYIYGRSFDPARLEEARKAMADLEGLWS